MFNAALTYLIEAAFREAVTHHHLYFSVEHLFHAVLQDEDVVEVLEECGGDIEKLRTKVNEFFTNSIETQSAEKPFEDPVQTPACRRVLQRALMQMESQGKNIVAPVDLLVSIVGEQDSHAAFFLKEQNITRLDIIDYISHGVSKLETGIEYDFERAEEEDDESSEAGDQTQRPKKGSILEQLTENLTLRAKRGEFDPVIGREQEIERAIKILARRQKNNPLFIGEPGVGKTSLAYAIAQKIVAGDVPEKLKGTEIFSLHVGSLVAGTKFRGEFEDRLKKVVKELVQRKNAILFIDEIHTLIGAGATGSGSMDAANLLKPALQSGEIRCMGSITHEDYKKSFEKDRALNRRFSTIEVNEPSTEDTVKILKGIISKYEKYHGVKYASGSLKAAAELSAKHIAGRLLPDKAIDVIDEAGATNALLIPTKRKKTLTEKEIEAVVSLMARVPVKAVSRDDEDQLKNLESNLKRFIFGQDESVAAVARSIKRRRANLTGDHKPIGSFLCAGPTGVGKTELAKKLAEELGVQFHRFDMTEYMEKHAVARLIGAPPGYVGYDEGGQLTDLVRKHPFAVLLLDEIEKAHEDIYNILLQIMDAAQLTDSQGKKADFRNIILIMTTNAGSDKAEALGFGESTGKGNRDTAIKKLFKPEFRNRLDEILYFNPLPHAVVLKVVQKFIKELEVQLAERKIVITLTDEAQEWLAHKGYDPLLGARPMARVIQKEIKDPLTDEILFGKLKGGGKIAITAKDDKLNMVYD